MSKIASLYVEVGANVNNFNRGMRQVDNQVESSSKKMGFWANTLSTGLGVLAAKGASNLLSLGKSIISTGFDFNSMKENAQIAFTTMLGSADGAKKFLADLNTFAIKTPFELPGLIESAQKLKAFGFEAGSIIPMLTNIGDATAGLGGSPELLNRITIALGQIKAKGKVQAEEMLQLTEAGIPAWQILADTMGKSVQEVMDMTRKGAISADTAISGLLNGMNQRFGGLMEKQSKTWSGLLSTVKDRFRSVASTVIKPLFDLALKGLTKLDEWSNTTSFQKFVDMLTSGVAKAASGASKLFDIITSEGTIKTLKLLGTIFINLGRTLAKFVRPFTDAIGGLFKRLAVLKTIGFADVFSGIVEAVKTLFSGLWKFVTNDLFPLIVNGIKAFITYLSEVDWANVWETIKTSINNVFEYIKNIDWTGIWETIKSAISNILNYLSKVDWSAIWHGIVNIGKTLLPILQSVLSDIVTWIVGEENKNKLFTAITKTWTFLTDWVNGLWTTVGPSLTTFWNTLVSWWKGNDDTTLSDVFKSFWIFLKDLASYLWNSLKPSLDSFWSSIKQWLADHNIESPKKWFDTLTMWAKDLWSGDDGLKQYLDSWWANFEGWMVETFPKTKTPLDKLTSNFNKLFAELNLLLTNGNTNVNGQWRNMWQVFFGTSNSSFEDVLASAIDFGARIELTLSNIIRLIRLAANGDWAAVWSDLKSYAIEFWNYMKTSFDYSGPDVQTIINAFNSFGNGIKNAFISGLSGIREYFENNVINPIKHALNSLVQVLNNTTSSFSTMGVYVPPIPEPFPGYAMGGIVGSDNTILVGEKGAELMTVPTGTRVHSHAQSMGMMNQGSRSRIDVYVHADSNTRVSRELVDGVAAQLHKQLQLRGNSTFVYAR